MPSSVVLCPRPLSIRHNEKDFERWYLSNDVGILQKYLVFAKAGNIIVS